MFSVRVVSPYEVSFEEEPKAWFEWCENPKVEFGEFEKVECERVEFEILEFWKVGEK